MGKHKKKEEAVFLRKKITLLRAFSLLIGSMVGSGIFISPKGVLKNSGTVGFSLVVWFACGLLSMFGALCYAELGTRITKSGGHYIYILETLGPLPSFLFLWAEFFAIRPANSAVVSLAFGRYLLEPFFAPCAAPVPAVKLVSLLGYYAVLTLNSWSVTWSARLQTALSVVKLLALMLIIVPGMMLLAQGHTKNFQDAFDRQSLVPDKLPLAFYAGMFAYSGWFQTSFVREELVRPERNIPLAVIVSVITVIVGYMLTNISYYTALGTQDVLASPAVAVDTVCGLQGRAMASSLLHDPHSKTYTPSCCHAYVPFGYCHGVYWRYLPSTELLQLFPMALHRISHPWAHCPSVPSPGAAKPIQGPSVCSSLFYHHLPLHSGHVYLLRPCKH
ncbi:cystine/glutamate transporter isoform X2 [Gallus gallus]|uniref:cystine/glutamate transporter isoform X2 n=1 Tax=Gallus gallus TaxID=9031 RepID=UPI001AE428F2|nr:cystine/glutamate transporter isoform X2 [Gallus gallus]XP_040516790.1 cystine/glutamate transporter isoform X2 [Gallus gallus]